MNNAGSLERARTTLWRMFHRVTLRSVGDDYGLDPNALSGDRSPGPRLLQAPAVVPATAHRPLRQRAGDCPNLLLMPRSSSGLGVASARRA